jgi:hypothetical protein
MMLTIVDSALFLAEPVLELAEAVAEEVPVDERVTPCIPVHQQLSFIKGVKRKEHTARAQLSLAALSAAWRSVPLQLLAKHVDVELMNFVSRHRQWTSPG